MSVFARIEGHIVQRQCHSETCQEQGLITQEERPREMQEYMGNLSMKYEV